MAELDETTAATRPRRSGSTATSNELLGELRVALPGVQVLFAFLLAVPFNQGFAKVTDFQKRRLPRHAAAHGASPPRC